MKKRLYWSGEESPYVEWCDFTDKKSIMVNLSKVVFQSEENFNYHLQVLKKISDKEIFYEADDCERYQFDVFSSEAEIKGAVKIYLSKVKYSLAHKKSEGLQYRLDAYALLDIPNQFIEEGNKYISELKPSVDIIVLLVNVLDENLIDLSQSFNNADYILIYFKFI